MYDKLKNKNKNTTLSEQFQISIAKSEKDAKLIPLTHKYITTRFPGLANCIASKKKKKVAGLSYF